MLCVCDAVRVTARWPAREMEVPLVGFHHRRRDRGRRVAVASAGEMKVPLVGFHHTGSGAGSK